MPILGYLMYRHKLVFYILEIKIIKDISYSPKVPKRKKTKIKISDFIVKHQYSNNEKN